MEEKILKHISKNIKKVNYNNWGDILELYGPLTYKEYDEVIKYIDKTTIGKKNEDN
jgi:hypothetical protein|tara:strand:+ start:323 stop:490 length:168 start_codon:yes stop_codon:yes gene_type:complete